MARCALIHRFLGCEQRFGWMVGELERTQLETGDKEIWVSESYMDRPLKMGKKNMKILCPMWLLTKGWPQQMRVLLIKWIGRPLPWLPGSLFPQLPLSLPNGLMNKVALVAGMEVTRGLSNIGFHSPRPTYLRPLMSSSVCQQQRPTLSPWYGTIPQGDLVAGWLHRTAFIMGGAVFCSYWNRCLLWIQMGLPCMLCFFHKYHGLMEYRIYHCGIPHSGIIASD